MFSRRRLLGAASAALLSGGFRKGTKYTDPLAAALRVVQINGNSWGEGLVIKKGPQDAKIYLGGTINFAATFDPTNAFDHSAFRPFIIRLNPDLTIDTTWGAGGYSFVIDDFTTTTGKPNYRDWEATDIAFQPDGKILVAYIINFFNGSGLAFQYGVARLNSNGTLDNSFATNGTYIRDDGSSNYGRCHLGLLSNGTIIFVTVLEQFGGENCILTALNSSGALTAYFNGANQLEKTGVHADAIAVDQSNNIFVAGSLSASGVPGKLWVMKVNPSGVPDPSFGSSGIATPLTPPQTFMQAQGILLQQGQIVCAGLMDYNVGGNTGPFFARLNGNGTLDTTFGASSGYTAVQSGIQVNDTIGGQSFAFDGTKLVASGWTFNAGEQYYTPIAQGIVLRASANGIMDTTFGTSGILAIPTLAGDTHQNQETYSLCVLNPQQYILSGHVFASTVSTSQPWIATCNYGNIQTTANSFGTGPTVTTGAMSGNSGGNVTANATINPGSNPTTWCFQYGVASGRYSNQSNNGSAGSGSSGAAFTINITGLAPSQVYFGRAVAWSAAGGFTVGAEVTWTQA